jgi:hypothetical protein
MGGPNLRADYSNTVLSLKPVAYWPLNEHSERPDGDGALSQLTAHSSHDLYYSEGVTSTAGALVAETNSAVALDGFTGYLAFPLEPSLGLTSPFSVEGWFKPNNAAPACICSCGTFGSQRSGWALYYDPNYGWSFRLHATNSLAPSLNIEGGNSASGVWRHLVAVLDGTNGSLYVDGSLAAGPVAASGFTPTQDRQFTIGTRSDHAFPFGGSVDEVALYTNALAASVIEEHYRSGTNRSPSHSYASLIRRQHPLLYFRLDETNAFTAAVKSSASSPGDEAQIRERRIAFNYGSFGVDVNGTYQLGARPGSPGAPFHGLGSGGFACEFDGSFRGHVNCSSDSRLNITGPMTAIAWIKARPAGNRFQTFLGRSDFSWRADVDWEGLMRWADGKDNSDAVGVTHVNNGKWYFFAGVYDGGTNYVYVNGKLEGISRAFSPVAGSDGPTIIGSVGDYLHDRQFQGSVAQVAIFTNALSAEDILRLYRSADIAASTRK